MNLIKNSGRAAAAALFAFVLAGVVALQGWRPVLAADESVPLVVQTMAGVKHTFQVELADTPETRSLGLMYRRSMAPDRGMLFTHPHPQPLAMWMENTYISLDMFFVRGDGTIARIARRTKPFSRDTIASGEPVTAVLEVIAGTADRLGIAAGDRLIHPHFKR